MSSVKKRINQTVPDEIYQDDVSACMQVIKQGLCYFAFCLILVVMISAVLGIVL